MSKHLNIYGPQASGKTRNAHAFAKLFGCKNVVEADFPTDLGKLNAVLDDSVKTLILSIDPVFHPSDHRIKAMPIKTALKRLNQGKN